METLKNKIDFVAFVSAENANPNGDPLNGNRPRDTFDGYGEISDVCIKRKIRNRLQDMGENIFVKSAERSDDGFKSLKDRADGCTELKEISKGKNTDVDAYAKIACKQWMDVRSFGQVFAFRRDTASVGVRGPVSIHPAMSIAPVSIVSTQITKSVNSESKGDGKASDTMGMKHRIEFGIYKIKGSINCQIAEKTGFTDDDAQKIKEAIKTLFDNDSSSARPEGSMDVLKLFWFEHNCKNGQCSTSKVHNSVKAIACSEDAKFAEDYKFVFEASPELNGLTPEVIG